MPRSRPPALAAARLRAEQAACMLLALQAAGSACTAGIWVHNRRCWQSTRAAGTNATCRCAQSKHIPNPGFAERC